jgi:hypothetical protein
MFPDNGHSTREGGCTMKFETLLKDERTKRFTLGARDFIFSLYYMVGGTVSAAALEAFKANRWPTKSELSMAFGAGLFVGFQHLARKYATGPK